MYEGSRPWIKVPRMGWIRCVVVTLFGMGIWLAVLRSLFSQLRFSFRATIVEPLFRERR